MNRRGSAGAGSRKPPLEDTMLRSSPMSMVQVYMSKEIGREAVTALGQLGLLHFRDVRPS
jgi:V-type H+-transporting ATPase subunit a